MIAFIKKRLLSFVPAIKGLFWLFKNEGNAQFHLLATIAVLLAAYFFKLNTTEWFAVLFAIGMVISAEAFNTAIEKFVDLLHPQKHHKAGLIKDLAAAAVLITSIIAAIIAAIIFIPKI